MAEAAAQQLPGDDWKDIHPAEMQASPYSHGDDWHDIAPPVSLDEFAGPKITETPLYKAGESIQKSGRETFPVSEEERAAHPYATAIGRGAGAMLPAVAASLAAGPAGVLVGATQMGMSAEAETFDDALSKGADETTAARASGVSGALSMALGTLPLGAVLSPIRQKLPGMAGWAVGKLTQAAANGVTFATVGEAQQWLTTEVEKAYYDPNANYDPQFKDMLASFVVGSAFGTMHPLHRPAQEGVRPTEAPPLEGEAAGVLRSAEGRPEAAPEPARALPPLAEAAPAETEPPLQAYEALPVEQVRNPVTGTPEEKLAQLAKLTEENKPIVQDLMKEIDDRFGTKSNDNVKTDENILAKASRPSILAKRPWWGVEYIRDSYRFRTLMDTLFDVPPIVDMLKERGIGVVKSDVVKQFHPGEMGWRVSVFDLQMPNGQLVEYYLPVKEMDFAHDEAHELFEKWRNLDLKKLTPEQITAYEQDVLRSRDIYKNSWDAYLARTGDDPRALRAALTKIEASSPDTIRKVPSMVSSTENAIPGSQTPLTKEAAQPELRTSTSPDSSRMTVGAIPASTDNIRSTTGYDNRVDLPTRNLLAKEGLPHTVEELHPNDIRADPKRFQYKSLAAEGADTAIGHTGRTMKPGWQQTAPMVVWRGQDGQNYVVDGHHRLVLAKKLVKEQPDLRINGLVLNEGDISSADAKAFGQHRNEAREASRVKGIKTHRVTAADGSGIDVTPMAIEAEHAITSQDQGYDQALQPRERSRAASQAQVRDIATNLDPERLGYSAEADRGAPIIGPDGMVESGNGRVLALRRIYEQGAPQAQAYRDWLAKQGVDVSKFRNPILVRQRVTPFTPEQRRAFTVAANQPETLAMSAPERAMADARLIDANSLNLIVNPDDLSRNRDFIRKFIARLPQTEQGTMADARGALSSEGATRLRNAVLAKAYGDAGILTRVAESTNDEIKSISNALVAAAPRWARMRAEIEAGNVRRDVDLTPDLIEAVKRTADIRAKGQRLNEYLAQIDAFDKLPDTVEAFMRNFYDPKGRRAAGAERIRDVLRFYADEAAKVSAEKGLDLGLVKVEPRDILNLAQKKGWSDGREGRDAERGSAGDGAGESPGGGEARGPFLAPGREYAGEAGQAGHPETTERAQRPEIFRATGKDDAAPINFRPEEPDSGELLSTANKIADGWRDKLKGSGIKVIVGGSLVSRTHVHAGDQLPDMDVRFLTDNPERDYPKVEAVTGLKFRKSRPVTDYPSGESKGFLVEGQITRDGRKFDVEAMVRKPTHVGWAKFYPTVMTPDELSAFRADKARLKGDKEPYKALKKRMLDEVIRRVEERGGPYKVEREAQAPEPSDMQAQLHQLRDKWTARGVRNFVADRPSRGEMQLSDLVVPKEERGHGLGSQFMRDLTDFADAHGKTITLKTARDYGTTSLGRLKNFYKRFGFVENRGRNTDFAISDSMYRRPKGDTEKAGEVGRRERASGGRVESGTGKRTRDSFGYMEPSPNIPDFAQCGSCQLWIKDRDRCYWFSDTKKVEASDSCTEYVQGEPIKGDVKATNSLDPSEAGFIKGSTRCENCVSFNKNKTSCMLFEKLNRAQPDIFDLDEKVKPRGCCNAFSRDSAQHEKVVRRAGGGRVVSHYIDRNPSEAQIKAGNYRKAHINVHGLDISIENAKGHERFGVGKDGKPWSVTMPAHYGYIKRTDGADGDHVDCYVGPHHKSRRVFVVDQHDADTGKFDEHKCLIGFSSERQARKIYHLGFSDGRGSDRLGHLTEMGIEQFKHWLAGDTESPVKGTEHAPKIDTTKDVRWMSEMSKSGDTYYRDRSLPKQIINNGKWLPIDEPLKRHEVAEFNAIKKIVEDFEAKHGRKPDDAEREAIYLKCHKEHGEVAEHNWLKENGFDVKAWENWCHGKLDYLEHKRVFKPVPDPHVRPSPHDRRRLEAMQ